MSLERWSVFELCSATILVKLHRLLTALQFTSLDDARVKIEDWRMDYNQHRPHSSLGNLTRSDFVSKRQEYRPSEAVIFYRRTVRKMVRAFMLPHLL